MAGYAFTVGILVTSLGTAFGLQPLRREPQQPPGKGNRLLTYEETTP